MTVTSREVEPDPSQSGYVRSEYTPSYASSTSEAEHQALLEKIAYIPKQADAGAPYLVTLSYQVDHAIREAALADLNQWREESGTLIFTCSNKLKVYLGTPDNPLGVEEARTRIRELSLSTVITARIVLGIWNSRKSNGLLTENGSVVIRLEEILEWHGIKKKHSKKEPDSGKRYSHGYSTESRSRVLKDLDLLASCCIKGQVTCAYGGKLVREDIKSAYLHYHIIIRSIYRAEGTIVGISAKPGDWLGTYTKYDNHFIVRTNRKILQFHPYSQQHELKLALFLIERWRLQAREGSFDEPIVMAHLLALSMIRVTKANLTVQFVPRIQEALDVLQKQGIIGQIQCITPVDTSQPRWGNTWLASQWIIRPPAELATTTTNRIRPSAQTLENTLATKARETIHNGWRFRSRIEARWSIFFETLAIDYRYELEGYNFDGVGYLPDFWLPIHRCWVEIKGPEPTEDELQKAHLLSLYTEKPVYIFFGDIWLPSQQKYGGAYCCSGTRWEQGYYWYECPGCGMIGLASSKENGRFPCQCTTPLATQSNYNNSDRLMTAYKAARQARFEYQEQERERRPNRS